jgi:capsule polysaccharide export protein KpsE/RkpR
MIGSLQAKLDTQSGELTTLSTRLTDTMNSFRALSSELESLSLQLELERERVQARNKALLIIGIVGGAIILGKIAAFILYAKSVKIPRWLDIVL